MIDYPNGTTAHATRPALAPLVGQSIDVVAVYTLCVHRKEKPGYFHLLLRDVREVGTGRLLTDHCWVYVDQTWNKPQWVGRSIRLRAEVNAYQRRGESNYDYTLRRPVAY